MKSKFTNLRVSFAAAAGLVLSAMPATALEINLFNQGGVTVGSNAYNGFTKAANFWEKVLTNDVTVNLNVKFSTLGANILGSTGSTTQVSFVQPTFAALQATGNSALDAVKILPTLTLSQYGPGADGISALISAPKANGTGVLTSPLTRILDNNGSANNAAFSANTSLIKAIGLTPTYAVSNTNQIDGSISFSDAFNFDFDPTDGIAANAIDFIGVAIHEIGHALGFRSGVDTYDANTNYGGNLDVNLALMSVWDSFRYSAQSAALGVNDWAIGGTIANGNAPYFSIDGGASVYEGGYLSTGANFGDGRQASHWKDNTVGNPSLGLLDPTVAFGQQTFVTSLDLAAYDAMGWNVAYDVMAYNDRTFSTAEIGSDNFSVPDDGATIALLGLTLAGLACLRRRFAR